MKEINLSILSITTDERYVLRGALLTALINAQYDLPRAIEKGERWKASEYARVIYKMTRAIEILSWDDSKFPEFTEEEKKYDGSTLYFSDCPNCGKAHYNFCNEPPVVDVEFIDDTLPPEDEVVKPIVMNPVGWDKV